LGKPQEEGPIGKPRHKWEDNIEMDLREIVWGVTGRLHLVQGKD
jgi:hypothetical protein